MVNYTLQGFAQDPDVWTLVCDKTDTLHWEPRRRLNPACGPPEFRIKMLQITTEVFILKYYTFTFRVNALILTGSCECLCLRLCEWRIAGLIASPWHSNWGPENLVAKKTMFSFSANPPASSFWKVHLFRLSLDDFLFHGSTEQYCHIGNATQEQPWIFPLSLCLKVLLLVTQRNYVFIISSASLTYCVLDLCRYNQEGNESPAHCPAGIMPM